MATATDGREPGASEQDLLQFVERFALILTEAGWPRMAARVLTRLLCDDDGRMSAGELAASLRVSPAAVSGAVRFLQQVRLVHREREPGARRDHYRVDEDAWYQSVVQRNEQVLQWIDTLGDGAELLGPDTPGGRRLRESQEFFAFIREELMGMMDRWRDRQAPRR